MLSHHKSNPADALRAAGLRITPLRSKLLTLLQELQKPASALEIRSAWAGGSNIDLVTLYRALHAFRDAGVVRQLSLRSGLTHYELREPHNHHHHLVCTECGVTEAVRECPAKTVENQVLRRSRRFASLKEHSLEFFGTCKVCAS